MVEGDNRSTPNLIETILPRYLNKAQFVDALEMASVHADAALPKIVVIAALRHRKEADR